MCLFLRVSPAYTHPNTSALGSRPLRLLVTSASISVCWASSARVSVPRARRAHLCLRRATNAELRHFSPGELFEASSVSSRAQDSDPKKVLAHTNSRAVGIRISFCRHGKVLFKKKNINLISYNLLGVLLIYSLYTNKQGGVKRYCI
jgi:hypothetical protein